jgi:nicotinic acid mononucleotide adenylyltransferase
MTAVFTGGRRESVLIVLVVTASTAAAGALCWCCLRRGKRPEPVCGGKSPALGCLVVVAPTGGKTTHALMHPTMCVDVERDMDFGEVMRTLRVTTDVAVNWEYQMDLQRAFMRVAAPASLAHLSVGAVAMINLINAQNVAWAGTFLRGIHQMRHPVSADALVAAFVDADIGSIEENRSQSPTTRPTVCVGVVRDDDVDARLHERATFSRATWAFLHGGYSWTHSCHIILDGVASRFGLPKIASADTAALIIKPLEAEPVGALRVRLTREMAPDSWLRRGPWTKTWVGIWRQGNDDSDSRNVKWTFSNDFGAALASDAFIVARFALTRVLPNVYALFVVQLRRKDKQDLDAQIRLEGLYRMDPVNTTTTSMILRREPLARHVCLTSALGDVLRVIYSGTSIDISRRVAATSTTAEGGGSEGLFVYDSVQSEICTAPDEWRCCCSRCEQVRLASSGSSGPSRPYRNLADSKCPSLDMPESALELPRCPPPQSQRRVVLLYYGSFGPWHAGHLETLLCAKQFLETERPSTSVIAAYVNPILVAYDKEHAIPALQPWAIRADICKLATMSLPWVVVDHPPDADIGTYIINFIERVKQRFGANVNVVWVNGGDVPITKFMESLLMDRALELLFVQRRTSHHPAFDKQTHYRTTGKEIPREERRLIHHVHSATPYAPRLSLSSTLVRRHILDREIAVATRLIGNSAAAAWAFAAMYESTECKRAAATS